MTFIGNVPARLVAHSDGVKVWEEDLPPMPSSKDSHWPIACSCGYRFADDDAWQVFGEPIYRRRDNRELTTLRDAPDGAMWDAFWLDHRKGDDGLSVMVRCPGGGDWWIDGRASNCTMPKDQEHRCWVRHGEVPNLTVDKRGKTCGAGGGSIIAGKYHGFLRNGEFQP
ncbi:MAG: hypothetical protein M0027_16480 [Candidatus Dormibacteraeota bacterium]|nr:hypothetical protein [Candidatus Dormibacteraeota bacterium]